MGTKAQATQPQAGINVSKAMSRSVGKTKFKKRDRQTATGGGTADQHAHPAEVLLQCVLSTLPSALQKSNYCKKTLEMAAAAVKPPTVVAGNLVPAAKDPTKAGHWASEQPRRNESSSQPVLTELPLSAVKADRSVQCRAGINNQTVAQYAERMKAGDKFPPIHVFDDGSEKIVADGQHRFHGALKAELKTIAARIWQGTRKDAIKFAIQANTAHGLRFSNKDKRHAVELTLNEFPCLSDGAVAELCKVSQPFVSKLRNQLKTVMSSDAKVGRDGKTRKVKNKEKMAKAAPDAATPTEISAATGASTQNSGDGNAPANLEEFDFTKSLERCSNILWTELGKCSNAESQCFIDELQNILKAMMEAVREVERTRHSDPTEQSKQVVIGTIKPLKT